MNKVVIHPNFEFRLDEGMLIVKNEKITRTMIQESFESSLPGYGNAVDYISFVVFEQGVKEIPSRFFYKNNKLESIYLSDTIKLIGINAFCECHKLNKIYIDSLSFDLSSLNTAFKNDQNIIIYVKNINARNILEQYISENKLINYSVKLS